MSSTNLNELHKNLTDVVLGSKQYSWLLIIGLVSDGHVLIQGDPGIGKTTLAKTLAGSVDCTFNRIQFTPDLLPSDILGFSIFNEDKREFEFKEGPIFNNIVLADEINRTTPRIQSALLEAMNESQVSVDGVSRTLDKPFMVIATQNHNYSSGTFPLPDSQLDRFLISFDMERPAPGLMEDILNLHASHPENGSVKSVVTKEQILEHQEKVRKVGIEKNVIKYIVDIGNQVNNSDLFRTVLSSRAAISLMRATQGAAYVSGRDYVYPDDVKLVMPYVYAHRLVLKSKMQRQEKSIRAYLREICEQVKAP